MAGDKRTDPLTFLYKLVSGKDLYGSANYMTDSIVLFCSCANEEEARRIAEGLVESRLAACVNLLSGIQSIYRWEDQVETAREVLLLIKSNAERWEELRARITELHSYDTPEIIAVPITAGSEKYLNWIGRETSRGAPEG
jgi:periplasmic divalent cation tolerance protein